MTAKEFIQAIDELGWTRKRLASELGVTTETLRVYANDGPSKMAAIAVGALAKGFRLP